MNLTLIITGANNGIELEMTKAFLTIGERIAALDLDTANHYSSSMSQFFVAISTWLHSLATAIFIGYFLLLALIYLPALTKNGLDNNSGIFLSEISKRSRGWMYASLLTFIVTGIHLMLADPNYLGVGNFGNLWGMLMLVKHIIILGMIAMGFWFNAILRVGPQMSTNTGAALALKRFQLYAKAMAISGILVLLLTALAQME